MSKTAGKDEFSLPSKVESAEELYENAPCGYVSFLTDGTIININRTLLSWLGFNREEVLNNKKFNSLFKVGGKIFFETHFFPLIRMQGFIKEINFEIVRKDKTTFPGLLNVNEISRDKDNLKIYRATVFDITDRKIYEKELLEAKKKAENISEARAQFLATISHEIRTPLNGILGIANLLQKTELTAQQKEYGRILLHSSESLLGLVNNLLDLSKIEAQKVKLEQRPFDLADLMEVLVSTYEVKAEEKGIDLLVDFQEELPTQLIGDPVKLNQILTNLIGNAIKFTERGHVKLQISSAKTGDDQVVLHFQVSDTGIGIPQDKIQSILEEFSQASYEVNQTYGGTGLGLSISQKLLQLYGKELEVSSELGEGSNFSFEIPLRINAEQETPTPVSSKEKPSQLFSSARILIVDDNPVNIFIVSEYLNQWQLNYDSAESGKQAIAMVNETHYDLILMDLHMPTMDGYEASRKIRKLQLPKQPVIVALSASGRGDVNVKQRRAGINDYVTKPFSPGELFDALAHHLEISENNPGKIIPEESIEGEAAIVNSPKANPHPGSNESFDLSRLIKMASNKPEFLEKFINNTAKAFESYREDFEIAAKENSSEKILKLLHKSTMSNYYINAARLISLLEDSAELFAKDEQNVGMSRENNRRVKAEFDSIIKGLLAVDAGEVLHLQKQNE